MKEKKSGKKKTFSAKLFNVLRWVFLSVIGLIILILILVQLPFVQNFARKKAVTYLENKLHTKVEVGRLSVRLPTSVSLQNIYLEDQSQDTLLYGKSLRVNISMLRLLQNEIRINEIDLDGIVANVHREPPDSTFNFQFIVDAFASEEKEPEKKDTTPLNMSIDRVLIKKSHIVYKDLYTGNDVDLQLGYFETVIKTFDPSHLLFDISLLEIDGLRGHFNQLEPMQKPLENVVKETQDEPENVMRLHNKTIRLSDIDFQFNSDASHLRSSYVIGNAELNPKEIDLQKMIIAFKSASFDKTDVVIQTNSALENEPEKIQETDAEPSPSLQIIAEDLQLQKSSFRMDDIGKLRAPSGMDFSHLYLSDINIDASDLLYSSDTMRAKVKRAKLKEQSGFVLNELATQFEMNPTGVMLTDLKLKTPGSDIKRSIVLHYPSLESLSRNPGALGLDVNMENTTIALGDVLIFMPSLRQQLPVSPNESIFLNTRLTGTVSNLNIQRFLLKGLSATQINVHGTVAGLPNTEALTANLDIETFKTNRRDINAIVPKGTIPADIRLPDRISVNGKVRGGLSRLMATLDVDTDLGNADINGIVANATDKYRAVYDVKLAADKIQLGTILQNKDLGILTGNVAARGKGYEPNTANATFNVDVPAVDYNKYRYRNILAKGAIEDGDFNADFSVKDNNLSTSMSIKGSFMGKYPTISLEGIIDSIDAQALNFSEDALKYHGRISGDFDNLNPDSLDGKLFVTKSILVNKDQRITVDTISIVAKTADSSSIQVSTGFASLILKGDYRLTQMGDIFVNSINPYYKISKNDSVSPTDPYHFTINGTVLDHPTTRAVLPGLNDLQTIELRSTFNSDSGWSLKLASPHVDYNNLVVDELIVDAGTRDSVLGFDVNMGKLTSGKSIEVFRTKLIGTMKDDKADFSLDIRDRESKRKYHLTGSLEQAGGDSLVFSLSPDSLLLNYDKWQVDPNNELRMVGGGLIARSFILAEDNQQLRIESENQSPESPLLIEFSQFDVATITGFVQADSLLINGVLNGNARVEKLTESPVFITDLTVDDLSMYKDTLGNLTVKVDNKVANQYHADIALKGHGNDITVLGDYLVKPTNSSFDFNVNLNQFQMHSLVGITQGAISEADGYLYGKVALRGTMDSPDIDGRIQFNNTSFVPAALGTVYRIDKEAIAIINNQGIVFNSFTIEDTAHNKLTLGGRINTKDWEDYTFNMNIRADNFQAISSTSRDNDLFYGRFVFSTRLNIKGSPQQPVVDGDLTINENTDFTIVLPSQDPGVEKREGIVRFVDYSATSEDSIFLTAYDSLKTSPFLGYDVAVNITIDKEASFNVIVDPANGDFLHLKGTGELSGGMDPSGKINLTGSYEIEEGSYQLSFNFLQRNFQIQKGSRLVWTGDPTLAQVDITAIYVSNTAPYELVAGMTEGEQIYFKQKLPFEVHLNMDDELLDPEITFDIVLPDKNYTVGSSVTNTVQERLIQLRQEPSELNKQVFALLLLDHFVGENPFENSSGEGMSAGAFAKQSASRLLTEQLNNLADGLIQGVDVNFDLATSSDYTTGQKRDRTDFKVDVSKTLLNDRLTVTVGNNFELEGPQPTNQQHSGIADNISLNYKLSKDGRYMLRAYRKNDYTGALEGYVIETGIGFIINLDYNRFSQIFQSRSRREKRREVRRHNRQYSRRADARIEEKETNNSKANDSTNDQ